MNGYSFMEVNNKGSIWCKYIKTQVLLDWMDQVHGHRTTLGVWDGCFKGRITFHRKENQISHANEGRR